MAVYWLIFVSFLIPALLGYGGGPSSIPLVEYEVVQRQAFLTADEFVEVLALGNILPGPIATKMAGYIGFQAGGVLGAVIAVLATVLPSLIMMLALLKVLYRYKDSPRVQKLTALVRPVVAVLLALMAYRFLSQAYRDIGLLQTGLLFAAGYLLLERLKVHPALIIAGALAYGALFLGG